MGTYSVKELSKLAGVSVRTLHLYDKIGLLKPSSWTEARYRLYQEKELLRLQQILFYKELDFSLQEIAAILDDPDFDFLQALENHKSALIARQGRLSDMLVTIDQTILKLKGQTMLSDEDLYKGLPKEKAEAYRKEAIEKYGADTVKRSEDHLRKLSKEEFAKLGAESEEIRQKLFMLRYEDPASPEVQEQVHRHYNCIRMFWGTSGLSDSQAEAYRGLGQLYLSDERFTMIDGQAQPEYALFLSEAMSHYVNAKLL